MFVGPQLVFFALCLHSYQLHICSAEFQYQYSDDSDDSVEYSSDDEEDSEKSETKTDALETEPKLKLVDKPPKEEMKKFTEEEIYEKILECKESPELHCIAMPENCFGLNKTNKTPLESFKEECYGSLFFSGTTLSLSSGFNPPKKDNYFVAVGITTDDLHKAKDDPTIQKDMIIMGVRRPKGGHSNDEDEVFYGYVEKLSDYITTYHDIEWMYHYFGKTIQQVFHSAIYQGAPVGNVFKFWGHNFFLQWFSPQMGKSSFAMTKNQTEDVMSKMDERYKDQFKDIAMASLDVKKEYYWLFFSGYADDDFRKTRKLSIINGSMHASREPLPMVLTSGSSPTTLQPVFFMPNGTLVNLAANATWRIEYN